jgi:hypothetical protein
VKQVLRFIGVFAAAQLFASFIVGAGLPTGADAIFKAYTHDAKSGMTKAEFQRYLKDYTLSAGVKRLYDEGNEAVTKAVDTDTAAETDDAFARQGVPSGAGMTLANFQDYVKSFPPRKTPQTVTAPISKGILDDLTLDAKTKRSWLHDSAFHLTRTAPAPGQQTSLPGGSDPGPAQISWTHAVGSSAVFTIDGALSYTYELESLTDTEFLGYRPSVRIIPSFEAHTSNDPNNQQDSLKAKIDFQLGLNSKDENSSDLFQLQALSIAPTYERDRIKTTETYGADIFYTPIFKVIPGMTALQPLAFWRTAKTIPANPEEAARLAYPGFVWQPSIGFETGHATLASLPVFDSDPDFARFALKLKIDLYLVPQLDVSVGYSHRTFLTGNGDSYDFIDINPIWYIGSSLDDLNDPKKIHFAVGLDFKYGETTPSFKHVDSLSAFIGMKF